MSPNAKELVLVISNQEAFTQKYNIDLSKFSDYGKSSLIRTRAQESLGIKNAVTSFTINGNSFTYDALPESVATFVIPINQTTSVSQLEDYSNRIYYSKGYLHTNFSGEESITVSVFNTRCQQIEHGLHIPSV